SSWPRSSACSLPVSTSSTWAEESAQPTASRLPSGEKLSEPIQPGMETEKCSPASKGPMVKNATVSAVAQILLEVRARHSARGAVRRGGRHPCLPVRVASCHAEQCLAPAGGAFLCFDERDRRSGQPGLPAARIAAATLFSHIRECVAPAKQQALSSRMNFPPTQIQRRNHSQASACISRLNSCGVSYRRARNRSATPAFL